MSARDTPVTASPQRGATLVRMLVVVIALVALFALIGFFAVPPIVKGKLETTLTERLHRKVTIAGVKVNPFALSATVQGFVMREPNSEETAASFEELFVNLSSASLFRLAPIVEAVRLTKPYVHLVRRVDQTYNYQDLITEAQAQPRSEGPPARFSVNNIVIVDGRIAFDDLPKKNRHEVTDIKVGIPFISNLPGTVDIEVQPSLAAKVNGSPLELKGETKPFKETRETTLNIDLNQVELPKYVEYSPVPLPFRVVSGSLDTKLKLLFRTTSDDRPAQILLSGDAGLRKLDVREQGGAPAVSVASVDVSIDTLDLVENRVALKSVRVQSPEVHVTRGKDGRLNLLGLVPAAAAKPAADGAKAPPAKPFAFSVADLQVTGGKVHVADLVPESPYRVVLENVTANVQNLSNAPDAKAVVKVALDTDAKGRFSYDGTVALTPLAAEGKVGLGGWRLAALYPYYESALNLEVVDGTADAEGQVFVLQGAEGLALRLQGLNADVHKLALRFPGDKRLLASAPLITARDVNADVSKRIASIGELAGRDGLVWIRRKADGEVHFARLVKTRIDVAKSGEPPPADFAPWTYGAKLVNLQNFAFDYEDETVSPVAIAKISRTNVRFENFSNAKGARGLLQARGVVDKAGTFSVAGPVGINPPGGRLRVDARGLAIPFIQPFIDDKVNLAITAGTLAAKGEVTFDLPPGVPPKVLWVGDINLTDFASLDKPTSSDLLKWKSLYLSGVRTQLDPLEVAVNEVALADFYSRLILNADGTFNVQNLLRRPGDAKGAGRVRADGTRVVEEKRTEERPQQDQVAAEATEGGRIGGQPSESRARTASVPGGTALPANIRVGKVTLQGGNINFSDFFVKPNYSANLTGIGGSVTEMTPEKAGDLELRGKVDNTAPVEIAGRVNPLARDLFLDIKASARDIELPPLSPYSIKYAGYGIEKGKLSMNVKYFIENRKLSAENNIYLDQLTFGEKVESPTATKLPVLLAVSLLKDRNGVIDIDLPISGSLDDPQFSVGGLIVRVIVNLLTKIITAPFSALASAFGGKEELSYVEYAPGASGLDAGSKSRLDTLAKALNDRPQLKLEVSGRVDPAADREGLKQAYVGSRVKAQKTKQLTRSGRAPASLDEVTVSQEEYPALLKAAYGDETFPKPRNVIGLAKDLPVPEMENLMVTNAQVTDEDLRQLANRRAQSAKDYLVETGKVSAERVFLVAPKIGETESKDKGKPTRAEFSLK